MITKHFVYFWHEYEPEGEFSNWYPAPFTVEGITYHHTEQYMMAKKALICRDMDSYCRIMGEADPQECKNIGKTVQNYSLYGKIWEKAREEVMVNGLLAKFSQNSGLKDKLLKTEYKILAEASPYDQLWGIGIEASDAVKGVFWKGENLLGKALMRVREKLRSGTL